MCVGGSAQDRQSPPLLHAPLPAWCGNTACLVCLPGVPLTSCTRGGCLLQVERLEFCLEKVQQDYAYFNTLSRRFEEEGRRSGDSRW